jgi:hypothetical protein
VRHVDFELLPLGECINWDTLTIEIRGEEGEEMRLSEWWAGPAGLVGMVNHF